MRNELVLALVLASLAFTAGYLLPRSETHCPESVQALISPGIGGEVLRLVSSANSTIEAELYQFSFTPLMDELVRAHGRGVSVRVILEPRLSGDDNLDAAAFLVRHGVPVRWASLSFSNTHSKLAIIDGESALVGSPNWSYSAMFKNRETAAIISGKNAIREFRETFEEDWAAGTPA